MDNYEIKNRLLTAKELANYLQFAKQTIYNKCGKNAKHPLSIKPIRIGKIKIRCNIYNLDLDYNII